MSQLPQARNRAAKEGSGSGETNRRQPADHTTSK